MKLVTELEKGKVLEFYKAGRIFIDDFCNKIAGDFDEENLLESVNDFSAKVRCLRMGINKGLYTLIKEFVETHIVEVLFDTEVQMNLLH